MNREPTIRLASRGLVVDDRDRVLLFRAELEGRAPWWFAPGGALEPGETHAAALVRELAEETGLAMTLAQAGSPVWTRDQLFEWRGRLERHVEQFFLVRVASHEVDTSRMTGAELSDIRGHRWWSVDEIRESGEHFMPRRLAELLVPLLRGELPGVPVDAGE